MAASNLVIDTTIFIEFLRAKDKTKTVLYSISDKSPLAISAVTLYELLMGASTSEKKTDVQLLTTDLLILPFDNEVAKLAADIFHDLRTKNQLIEFRDIFIGATCLAFGLPLRTLNTKHFNRIKGLVLK